MSAILNFKGARTVVETCARVKPNERVLVVTDPILHRVAELVAGAARAGGAEVVVSIVPPGRWDGDEPPTMVSRSMLEADVVFFPIDKDIAHSNAIRAAIQNGARVMSMAGFTEELFADPAMEIDFEAQRPVCDRIARMLGAAAIVRVTSEAGTDITFSVAGREGNSHSCILDENKRFTGVPNVEANIAPVEGTADGTIVFDASIPNLRTGVLRSPVRLTVERGSVVGIDGGSDARSLERLWAAQNDPNVYNIAQFAIGLNPHAWEANGGIVHDHGLYGTVHFGIGTSSNLGGVVKAAGHIDGIMYEPTVYLDGVVILANRQLQGELAQAG